ncbi:MAG: membrane protein insertion efficiency factor YidD [Actinobacteria bacterium]|nr:membrane protein insertion efficiency factor YidD [Actinomycetota bacterium]
MKMIFVYIIRVYQILLSPIIRNILGVKNSCRFEVTCSEYARLSILKDGVIKGGAKSMLRILKCQPYF